jgi:hypothetical protein
MDTNSRTAQDFHEASPNHHKATRAIPQNHESPEWARMAARIRRSPGLSATRNAIDQRASA